MRRYFSKDVLKHERDILSKMTRGRWEAGTVELPAEATAGRRACVCAKSPTEDKPNNRTYIALMPCIEVTDEDIYNAIGTVASLNGYPRALAEIEVLQQENEELRSALKALSRKEDH